MQTGSLFQQTQLNAKLRTMEVKKAILKSWGVYIWLLACAQI